MSAIYKSLLSATSNTRDLGGYPTVSGCMTRRNIIWRSDAPTVWNASDVRTLKDHGMTSIIDLRTSQETEKHPCAYASEKGIVYHAFPGIMQTAGYLMMAVAIILITMKDEGTVHDTE